MSRAAVRPSPPLTGSATVPGDKSISHRALIIASQAEGASRLRGLSPGDDVRRTARALRALGVSLGAWGDDPLVVEGAGRGGWLEPARPLDLGNSGTGMRLLTGLLAAHPFFTVVTGDRSLRSRPMRRVAAPLRKMGARIDGRDGGTRAPLAVRGARLSGIAYDSPVASAQVKTALLLAGLLARGRTAVTEPARSRDHTERMLRFFGVPVTVRGLTVSVTGGRRWRGANLRIPGDPSAAAFPLIAALVTPKSKVTIRNVCVNPTRTGFIEILLAMGADLRLGRRRESGGEPVADITARAGALRGIDVPPGLVPRAIDEIPVIAAAALFAEGTTRITGAAELRHKESDRISTTARELSRLGGRLRELSDGLEIEGGRPLAGAVCSSHGDHRVAMAVAAVAGALGGRTVIRNFGCADTSFPTFLECMSSLGARLVIHK